MSFSYKSLNSNDITLTSYIANKPWEVTNSTLSQNGVTIFVGENIPITRENPFNPIDDVETTNEEYRRLIFESIKHLYYENYTSGSLTGEFFNSSSYFNYEQTTLVSGSMISSFKNLPTHEGVPKDSLSITSDSIIYDTSSSLYETSTFDSDKGGKIVVISIDKEIFGSGLTPNSVYISGSQYYLRDDGEGNIYNYNNEENYARYNSAIYDKDIYLELLNSNAPQLEYAGNIFYSHGLIVITNSDYFCVYGAPPTAVNDYITYLNTNTPQILDVLSNDFTDCGFIKYDSFNQESGDFPDYTYNTGFLYITPNQTSVIPGTYILGYTIENSSGIRSNTGSITLNITSNPLELNNLTHSLTPYGTASLTPITFSINYGVPHYSYSLDNGLSYISSNNLFDITISGSVTSSDNNILYIKDYLGNIVSQSFSTWYQPITYTYTIQYPPCGPTGTSGEIYISSSIAVSASVNGGPYVALPNLFQNATTSSIILLKDINNTTTSSTLIQSPIPSITSSLLINSASGYGAANGIFSLSLDNIFPSLNPVYTIKTGSYILPSFNGILITTPSYTFYTSSLPAGIYTASAILTAPYSCNLQQYINYITITQPSLIEFSLTGSYIDSCSNAIIVNATGGVPPYTYFAKNNNTLNVYSSDTSTITLNGLNSGSYNVSIVDDNSFTSPTQNIDIYGRAYIYTGSICEQTP